MFVLSLLFLKNLSRYVSNNPRTKYYKVLDTDKNDLSCIEKIFTFWKKN